MLGALLRIGQELVLQRLVLVRRRAARPGAGERPDRHRAVAQPHQHLGARSGDRVAAEVEEIQKRRRIDAAQRAVERKRRQRERRLEALRQHHLENVAGQDVVLGLLHHASGIRPAWCWISAECRAGRVACPAAALSSGRSSASTTPARRSSRARQRRLRRDARLRPHRRDDGDRSPSPRRTPRRASAGSAPRRECRSDRDGRRAVPPSAAPCRSRDSRTRRPPSAAGRRAARCGFRRSARAAPASGGCGQGAKAVGIAARIAVDLGPRAVRSPDQVGIEPDHRIAAAHRAAFDRLEQKAHRPARRRSSGTPRPAFRDRRRAWSTPPAASPRS